MLFVTDFADHAVVLPLALIVAAVLAVMGWWRGLAAWMAAVTVTLGLVITLRMAGYVQPGASGHAAAATMVYGGVAVLMSRDRYRLAIVLLLPAVIIGIIGYTNVALTARPWQEVAVGGLVGGVGAALVALLAGPQPQVAGWPMIAAVACTMLAFHGIHMPAEAAIQASFLGR